MTSVDSIPADASEYSEPITDRAEEDHLHTMAELYFMLRKNFDMQRQLETADYGTPFGWWKQGR